jgi:uncharacterized membrane protein
MINVERRRILQAPVHVVRAILVDVEHLPQLMPRVERVEVRGNTDNRARLALDFRAGRLGTQRIEGEARILEDGLRFVAVRPAQIDARWSAQEHGATTEVTARLTIDSGSLLGPISRFVPRALVEQRIAKELEASLDALEQLVAK